MVVEVFIKNIPFDADEDIVSRAVRDALSDAQHGHGVPKVGVVSLPYDRSRQRIRGFGFVTVQTGDLSAEEAITAIFGTKILGRTVHAERFIPRGER
jgi:RNA recognition motif-containing protein